MPVEYSGEEQAICAVGLVKPRPDVFVEAVQYLLVLCTTVEVCASCSPSVYWHGCVRVVPGSCFATGCHSPSWSQPLQMPCDVFAGR